MLLTKEDLPVEAISECCRRFQVVELSVFGSVARGTAEPDSDVDFLVEFDPEAEVGLLTLARLTNELSDLLGRKVDVVPKNGLKPRIRDHVLAEARVLYAA